MSGANATICHPYCRLLPHLYRIDYSIFMPFVMLGWSIDLWIIRECWLKFQDISKLMLNMAFVMASRAYPDEMPQFATSCLGFR